MNWRDSAACKGMGTDLFFPTSGDMKGLAAAKAVCKTCPVKMYCLTDALAEEHGEQPIGVRGGMSGRDRRNIHMQDRRYRRPAA